MPADNKKEMLRSLLTGKTTEELEELLALDFADDKPEVDADYISTILEVIEEREKDKNITDTETAWEEFREYYRLSKQETKALETGRTENPNLDHHRKTEQSKRPRRSFNLVRNALVAAVLVILLCGTAMGWNFFRVIAEWTEETFQFLTGQSGNELPKVEELVFLRHKVSEYTDIPCIPICAPEGTQKNGDLIVIEQNDRRSVGMGYIIDERSFAIRISLYNDEIENKSNIYQKDAALLEEYVVDGIIHYIAKNNSNLSAMWVNKNVEGHIYGDLALEEMRQMIDSIYKE